MSVRIDRLCDAGVQFTATEPKTLLPGQRVTGNEIADDAAQVAAAKTGDRVAFGMLYERYARMVHGILLGRVPQLEVDDLLNEVFLTALRELPKLRNDAVFGAWLAKITRNRAHDYFRRSPA